MTLDQYFKHNMKHIRAMEEYTPGNASAKSHGPFTWSQEIQSYFIKLVQTSANIAPLSLIVFALVYTININFDP